MRDRRYYQRTKINIETILLLSDKNVFPREFDGKLEDISLGGVKIVIDPVSYSNLTEPIFINDDIHFTSYDEYHLFDKDLSAIVRGEAKVVRIDDSGENVILGCMFRHLSPELEKYVTDKETCSFVDQYL